MAEDIFVTVHLTLNEGNISDAEETLERLAKLSVQSLSLTMPDNSLRDTYDTIRNKAASLGLTLKFDLPVPYSASNPVAYETQEDNVPAGAGKAWLYVEPDGDVLPAQGMASQVLGNFLKDEWGKIYRS
jgi:MoaA/NifB/PqqE/SkfB family radical SAM enzyme